MIIHNNFNEKDINPLKGYKSIGEGSSSFDELYDIKKNDETHDKEDKKIIEDIINSDHAYEEDDEEVKDKWDFFK